MNIHLCWFFFVCVCGKHIEKILVHTCKLAKTVEKCQMHKILKHFLTHTKTYKHMKTETYPVVLYQKPENRAPYKMPATTFFFFFFDSLYIKNSQLLPENIV